MLEITTHHFLLFKRKEFWFFDSEKINKGTYNVFCYSNEKDASKKERVLKEQTNLIKLERTTEELFSQINRTFKYHIHKAEKMGVVAQIDYSPSFKKCKNLIVEFSTFAKEKSIAWSPQRIMALQKINKLIISESFLKGEKISTHVYLHDTKRVVLLHSYHSGNTNEKLRAYSNKYLHWQDIQSFKSSELKTYDFGGINLEQHPGISKFKISFGGEVIDCYSYIEMPAYLTLAISAYKKLRK